MKTDEHEKSMNADPEDVEGDPDIVKNQSMGYGTSPASPQARPPAAASRMNTGGSTPPAMGKSFMSVTLSKAHGSPCAPKPTSEDKGPMWVGGKTSKEVPREEDGEYTPPGWSDKDDEDDKKKDVKKSFVSAQLSKAGRLTVQGGTPTEQAAVLKRAAAPKAAQGKSVKIVKPEAIESLKGSKMPQIQKEIEAEEAKQSSAAKSRFLGVDPPIPGEFQTKKIGGTSVRVNKSLTELRYGSQLARNHDIGKSCGMCGRISKSCGDHDGGGCCEDCKKSMSSVNWHDSHLS